jgi:hypothetical protein
MLRPRLAVAVRMARVRMFCGLVPPLRGCVVSIVSIGSHRFRGGLRCFVPDGTGGERTAHLFAALISLTNCSTSAAAGKDRERATPLSAQRERKSLMPRLAVVSMARGGCFGALCRPSGAVSCLLC